MTKTDQGTLHVFVTVGTTKFDALIRAVLSHAFLSEIATLSADSVKLTIQYGNSSIADILTSSSLASVDDGSELLPEPGLRFIGGRRVYQNKADLPELDPGKTGTLKGVRLRLPSRQRDGEHEAESTIDTHGSSKTNFLSGTTFEATTQQGVEILLFPFAPSLKDHLEASSVVISHAGSGTILDTLRIKPTAPALVAVPNTSLMDNHQAELSEALAHDHYLIAGSPSTLAKDVGKALAERARGGVAPFPDFEPGRFTAIVDDLMGY